MSNHPQLKCLLNSLFRQRKQLRNKTASNKENSAAFPFGEENTAIIDGFPSQRAMDAENLSMPFDLFEIFFYLKRPDVFPNGFGEILWDSASLWIYVEVLCIIEYPSETPLKPKSRLAITYWSIIPSLWNFALSAILLCSVEKFQNNWTTETDVI